MEDVYAELNRKWEATCRLLFGREVGELKKYEKWLSEFMEEMGNAKCGVSGEEVRHVSPEYCEGSRRVAHSEVDFEKKFAPLSINEIKDVESIVQAVQERTAYAGNLVLGNSKFVQKSSGIIDSFWAHGCGTVSNSKYAAYVTNTRFSESVFGCDQIAESSYAIRSYIARKCMRAFEAWQCDTIADCIYVQYAENCAECAFCFNIRNKRNAIGNLEIGKEKYAQVRKTLGEQMADGLGRKGKLPSIIELAAGAKPPAQKMQEIARKARKKSVLENKEAIEKGFSQTTQVVLGKPLAGIDNYERWLLRHTRSIEECNSCASGRKIFLAKYSGLLQYPRDKLLSLEEARIAGEGLKFNEQEALGAEMESIGGVLGKIALFCPERDVGTNSNIVGSGLAIWSNDCYKVPNCVFSKHCAFSYWPRNSEYLFGCNVVLESAFCINCYNSQKLMRCFELESCRDCADSYYLHNCENVRDSMFCFNAKNLQYAIGNAVVGRERYLAAKKMLLERVHAQLAAKKEVSLDIYNLGCAGKN